MANLANLKIYVNPATAANALATDENGILTNSTYTADGVFVLDEKAKLFYVRGKGYGLSATQASSLATLLADDTTSGSVAYQVKGVNDKIGTLTGALAGMTGADATASKTVAELITALQTEITNLSTTVSTNASNAVQISANESTLVNTDAIKSAINAVKATGSDTVSTESVAGAKLYAASEASAAQSNAVSTVIGDTTTGHHTISSSTTVLNPNDGDNNTWLNGEEQTLSHLKDLINVITGGSSVDLTSIQSTIAAIENELKVADEETVNYASTILDAYKTLRGTGALTLGGTAISSQTLQGIIDALESAINAADAKHSVVAGGSGSEGSTNYAVVSSLTNGTTGQTTYTVKTSSALDTALTNAKTAINTVNTDANGGTTNYVKITKLTSGNDTYTVTTTQALDQALANATAAASQVISWEVIGSGS